MTSPKKDIPDRHPDITIWVEDDGVVIGTTPVTHATEVMQAAEQLLIESAHLASMNGKNWRACLWHIAYNATDQLQDQEERNAERSHPEG